MTNSNISPPQWIHFGLLNAYISRMNLRCFLGRHRPLLTSIAKREAGYSALCNECGLPIKREESGRWTLPQPLVSRRDEAA